METTSIENVIYEAMLIQPINKIITQLKNDNFRDCDIKWLNSKLEKFTKIALDTLGEKAIILPQLYDKDMLLNEFFKNEFIGQFETLLNYFKSI